MATRENETSSAVTADDVTAACELSDGRHRIFTYGTLMTGFHNHHYLEQTEFLGPSFTVNLFQMYARNPKTEYHTSIPFVAMGGGRAALETPSTHLQPVCFPPCADEDVSFLNQHATHDRRHPRA